MHKRKISYFDNKLNESDWDLANIKFELDSLDDMNFGDLKLSIDEMFPEFTTTEFNPEEFKDNEDDEEYENWESKESWLSLIVFVKDEWELELLKKDLDELGYRYK